MARDRIISGETTSRDEGFLDNVLRPRRLSECIGHKPIIEQLTIALDAAKKRAEPLEHVLLDGPPGLGKTTLAHVIANELGATIRVTSGPAIMKQSDLLSLLTNLETGDVLFIDEVHRLPRVAEEFLYPAMEDFRVDFTIEGGLSGRTINFALNRFTLIGATTRAGLLTAALRDRFGLRFHLDFWTADDLLTMLQRSAAKLSVHADHDALETIASRSRGTPRVANRLLRRARDYAQVRADGKLTRPVVLRALEILQVDEAGLDELDRSFLQALIGTYNGGPAGIEAIAATMGQERDTLEDVVEPYLLQIGFVVRTARGRQATRAAYEHLGLPTPAREPAGPEPADESPTLF